MISTHQVLGCLRLKTRLVRSDEKRASITAGPFSNRSHEDIVSWTIDERDVSHVSFVRRRRMSFIL